MPLWDDSPLKLPKLPIVTWGLIVANVVVFAFTAAAPPDMQPAILNFAVTPANITAAPIDPTLIPPDLTLVSYMFLHANLWHLLGNVIFLWVFGDDIEEAMGPLHFIGFYLASEVVAALIFVASAPHSQQPLVGASGAIAGVLAGYLMFRPCQKVLVFLPWFLLWFIVRPVVRLDASWVLGGWLLLQLWSISIQTQDDVAYMAHVGGVVAGGRAIPAIALPHRAAVRMRPGGQGAVEPDRLAGLISCGAA